MESIETKLIDIVTMFLQRDRLHQSISQKIIDMLQPTVFGALSTFLNVKEDALTWVNVDLESGLLQLTMIVTYGKYDNVPPQIELLAPTPEDDDDQNVDRILKITLPITLVFGDQQPMLDYMYDTLKQYVQEMYGEQAAEVIQPPPKHDPQFDVELQQYQIDMLSLTNYNKGTKH